MIGLNWLIEEKWRGTHNCKALVLEGTLERGDFSPPGSFKAVVGVVEDLWDQVESVVPEAGALGAENDDYEKCRACVTIYNKWRAGGVSTTVKTIVPKLKSTRDSARNNVNSSWIMNLYQRLPLKDWSWGTWGSHLWLEGVISLSLELKRRVNVKYLFLKMLT